MSLLIEAQNLHKFFEELHAVDGLSLQVKAGEIFALVGPDGAGKTTTIRLLCGALRPSHCPDGKTPSIRIAGYDLLRQPDLARAEIGYLPQRFSLYEELTVLENIHFFAEVRGIPASEWKPRCMEILKFVGLEEFIHRPAGQLSGGMKQKLGLAAALVHKPRVLLLDEPTTGVDPVTRQDFWQLIIRLVMPATRNQNSHKGDVAVLISTPYMDEAMRCTRVGFMRGGRLLLEGPPAELINQLSGRLLELSGIPLPVLRELAKETEFVEDVHMFGDCLHLRIQPGKNQDVVNQLTQKIPLRGGQIKFIREIPPQLEDIFIALLEQDGENGQENQRELRE